MTDSNSNLRNLFDKNRLILFSDGDHLFSVLEGLIREGESKSITLDFEGIDLVTTAFLNSSIGKFKIQYPEITLIYKNTNTLVKRKIEKTEQITKSDRSKFYNKTTRDILCNTVQ